MLTTAHNSELSSIRTIGDIRAEFQTLVSGCGIYDLSWRAKVKLTGQDRVRWLNGMVTNNVKDLVAGHGVYAFLLNPQGHILGDLYAYQRGESIWLDIDVTQVARTLQIFDRYIIMDDVEVENVTDKASVLCVSGPKAGEVLRTAGFETAELKPLELRDLEWQKIPLTLVHKEYNSYEIWLSPENAGQVRDVLMQSGAVPVGTAALDLYRIALGVPRYGQDIRERDLPQETNQEQALNFSKGCYVGQEIVERIRSRGAVHRTFTGFLLEAPLPLVGAKIQANGKDVGEITSIAVLPLKSSEQPVALGYIRREVGPLGKEVFAGESKATVAELPFKIVFG